MVKDLLLGAAAVTTAIVAVLGLKSWYRELRGRTDFEVARQLIRATCKVRDQLHYARLSFVDEREFPDDYPGVGNATARKEAEAWNYIYTNRWKPVREALREFESAALEAEVLWGQGIRRATDRFRRCAQEVEVAMETVVRDKLEGGMTFKSDPGLGEEMKAAVSTHSSDRENKITKDVQTAVDNIESQLRPFIRRS